MIKLVSKALAILAFGFIIGWSAKLIYVAQQIPKIEQSIEPALVQSHVAASSKSPPSSSTAVNDTPSAPAGGSETPRLQDDVTLETAQQVITYLERAMNQPDFSLLGQRALRDQLAQHPELAIELILAIAELEDSRLTFSLGMLLEISNSQQRPFLEPLLMEKIKAGDNASIFLRVLGDWGLQSKSSLAYLYHQLDSFENPEDLSNTIRAFTKSSWAQNAALSPAERQGLIDAIKPLFDSEHETLRAAAISSLRSLPAAELRQRVLNGLKDPHPRVQEQAGLFLASNPINTEPFKAAVISQLQNQTVALKQRSLLAQIAKSMQLTATEQEKVALLQTQVDQQVEALSAAERAAYHYSR